MLMSTQAVTQGNPSGATAQSNTNVLQQSQFSNNLNNVTDQIQSVKKQLLDMKVEISTSLQNLSDKFTTLSRELDTFKKDAETVQYKSQEDVIKLFKKFQEKLNLASKSFEKIEEKIEKFQKLVVEQHYSTTQSESNMEDFTKILSEVATTSHRTQVDAKYVSLRIADLPKMEDLVAKMLDEAKRIKTYTNSTEIIDNGWDRIWSSVKEDKKNDFKDFVKTSKESYETLFSTLLELGEAIPETLGKITSIDEKNEYAANLAQSNTVQKELNIKNFAEISKLGNAVNKFLTDKYTNIIAALFNANEALNYENSYIQTVAEDTAMLLPLRTRWSVTVNPNMQVDAKLVKIEVPVIVASVKVEDNTVKTSDSKTEEGTAVAQSSELKPEDVLLKV